MLNQNEFARLCGVSVQTIRWHVAKGHLRVKKVIETKERILIPAEEVETYKRIATKNKASS